MSNIAQGNNLHKAFDQWASRPADQRFWTIEEMVQACYRNHQNSVTSKVEYRDLRVEAAGAGLKLIGKEGTNAGMTHYAFGQLAQKVKAPASYLRQLPATLAAQNINHGLKKRADAADAANLLFRQEDGAFVLQAALSESYQRIWNYEVGQRLMELESQGWRVPPARPAGSGDQARTRIATEADVLANRSSGLSVQVGDSISPAGVYASDRDMFVFLVNESKTVDDGTGSGLSRFLMLWNSEVGNKSFGGMGGYYKSVCGNHIVWDATDVMEFRIRHTGKARSRAWQQLHMDVRQYSNQTVQGTELKIKQARSYELGSDKDSVIEKVLGFARKKRIDITKVNLESAYDAAERHEDWYNCPPTTVYGVVNGLTEVSQRSSHASDRAKMDRAAGKIMAMAF